MLQNKFLTIVVSLFIFIPVLQATVGPSTYAGIAIQNLLMPGENNESKPLHISNGKKRKTIEAGDDITVRYRKRGQRHDSLEMMAKGEFIEYRNDTLLILTDDFSMHNFYKKYPDTLHYTSTILYDTAIIIKVPAKDVGEVFYKRKSFIKTMTSITLVFFVAEIVTIPLSLFGKTAEMRDNFSRAGLATGITWTTTTSLGLIFAKKKFTLGETPGKKNKWYIENSPGHR